MSSETPQFSIRRAGVADAATVADIATRTFVETFGAMYPPEDLEFFLRDSYSIEKQTIILSHPDYAIFLLERDSVVVGHAAAGPCGLPHPQVAPGDGELKRLYLLREAQNGGWGARLFETVLEWLLRDGPRTLWIGVWSENFGAQRFYARYGFERVGEYEFIVGGTHDHEFVLRRGAAG